MARREVLRRFLRSEQEFVLHLRVLQVCLVQPLKASDAHLRFGAGVSDNDRLIALRIALETLLRFHQDLLLPVVHKSFLDSCNIDSKTPEPPPHARGVPKSPTRRHPRSVECFFIENDLRTYVKYAEFFHGIDFDQLCKQNQGARDLLHRTVTLPHASDTAEFGGQQQDCDDDDGETAEQQTQADMQARDNASAATAASATAASVPAETTQKRSILDLLSSVLSRPLQYARLLKAVRVATDRAHPHGAALDKALEVLTYLVLDIEDRAQRRDTLQGKGSNDSEEKDTWRFVPMPLFYLQEGEVSALALHRRIIFLGTSKGALLKYVVQTNQGQNLALAPDHLLSPPPVAGVATAVTGQSSQKPLAPRKRGPTAWQNRQQQQQQLQLQQKQQQSKQERARSTSSSSGNSTSTSGGRRTRGSGLPVVFACEKVATVPDVSLHHDQEGFQWSQWNQSNTSAPIQQVEVCMAFKCIFVLCNGVLSAFKIADLAFIENVKPAGARNLHGKKITAFSHRLRPVTGQGKGLRGSEVAMALVCGRRVHIAHTVMVGSGKVAWQVVKELGVGEAPSVVCWVSSSLVSVGSQRDMVLLDTRSGRQIVLGEMEAMGASASARSPTIVPLSLTLSRPGQPANEPTRTARRTVQLLGFGEQACLHHLLPEPRPERNSAGVKSMVRSLVRWPAQPLSVEACLPYIFALFENVVIVYQFVDPKRQQPRPQQQPRQQPKGKESRQQETRVKEGRDRVARSGSKNSNSNSSTASISIDAFAMRLLSGGLREVQRLPVTVGNLLCAERVTRGAASSQEVTPAESSQKQGKAGAVAPVPASATSAAAESIASEPQVRPASAPAGASTLQTVGEAGLSPLADSPATLQSVIEEQSQQHPPQQISISSRNLSGADSPLLPGSLTASAFDNDADSNQIDLQGPEGQDAVESLSRDQSQQQQQEHTQEQQQPQPQPQHLQRPAASAMHSVRSSLSPFVLLSRRMQVYYLQPLPLTVMQADKRWMNSLIRASDEGGIMVPISEMVTSHALAVLACPRHPFGQAVRAFVNHVHAKLALSPRQWTQLRAHWRAKGLNRAVAEFEGSLELEQQSQSVAETAVTSAKQQLQQQPSSDEDDDDQSSSESSAEDNEEEEGKVNGSESQGETAPLAPHHPRVRQRARRHRRRLQRQFLAARVAEARALAHSVTGRLGGMVTALWPELQQLGLQELCDGPIESAVYGPCDSGGIQASFADAVLPVFERDRLNRKLDRRFRAACVRLSQATPTEFGSKLLSGSGEHEDKSNGDEKAPEQASGRGSSGGSDASVATLDGESDGGTATTAPACLQCQVLAEEEERQASARARLGKRLAPFHVVVTMAKGLDSIQNPLGKLRQLCRIHDGVARAAEEVWRKSTHPPRTGSYIMPADEFLPLLCYVLVQARPRKPFASTTYMTAFLKHDQMISQFGYIATSVEIAIRHIVCMPTASASAPSPAGTSLNDRGNSSGIALGVVGSDSVAEAQLRKFSQQGNLHLGLVGAVGTPPKQAGTQHGEEVSESLSPQDQQQSSEADPVPVADGLSTPVRVPRRRRRYMSSPVTASSSSPLSSTPDNEHATGPTVPAPGLVAGKTPSRPVPWEFWTPRNRKRSMCLPGEELLAPLTKASSSSSKLVRPQQPSLSDTLTAILPRGHKRLI